MASESKDPKRRPRRSLLRRLAWCALVALVLLIALYLTRRNTVAPLLAIAIERLAGEALAGQVEIGDLESDLWTHVRLRNVRVRGRKSGGGPVRLLEIDECEARFSLLDLTRGRSDWLQRISARRGRVEIVPPESESEGDDWEIPEHLPEIDLSSIDVLTTLGDQRLFSPATRVQLSARPERGWDWSLGTGPLELDSGTEKLRPGALSLSGTFDGHELALQSGQLGDDIVLEPSVLDLGADAWSWAASAQIWGGRIEGKGHSDSTGDLAEARWSDVALQRLLEWLSINAATWNAEGLLDGQIRHQAGAEARTTVEVSARKAQLFGVACHHLDASGELHGDRVDLERFSARSGDNRLEARSIRIPLSEPDPVRSLAGQFELILADLPGLLSQLGWATQSAPVPPHEIRCAGRLTAGELDLTTAQLTTDVGGARLLSPIHARLPLDGGWRDLEVLAAVEIDIAQLERVASLFGWPERTLGGRLDGELHFAGSLEAPRLFCWLSGEGLQVQGRPLGRLELRATSDGDELRLEHLEIRDGANRIDGLGRFTLSREWIRELRIDIDVADLTPYLPPALTGGNVRAHLEASGSWRNPTAEFFAEGTLTREGSSGPDFLRLEGRSRSGQLTLRRLRAETGGARLDLRGVLDHSRVFEGRGEAEVTTLRWSEGPRTLVNRAPFSLRWTPAGWGLEDFELTGPSSSIQGRASGTAEGQIDVTAELAGFDTDWFGKHRPADWPEAQGIDLSLSAQGAGHDPEIRARGSVSRVSWRDIPPIALRVDIERTPDHLSLTALDIQDLEGIGSETGWIRLTASGELPDLWTRGASGWEDAPIQLEISARAPDLARLTPVVRTLLPESVDLPDLKGRATLEASIGGRVDQPTGRLWLSGESIAIEAPEGTSWPECHSGRVELRLVQDRDRWQIQTAQLSGSQGRLPVGPSVRETDSPDFQARLRGALLENIDLGRLVRTGELAPLGLDLHADLSVPDLTFLAAGIAAVRRTGGEVEMHVNVTGRTDDPVVKGTLRVRDGNLRLESRLPGLDSLTGLIRFDRDRISIEDFDGEMGAGQFSLSGEVRFDGPEPVLDVALINGRDLLLYRGEGFKTRTNADLKLSGPWSAMNLSGRVELTDSRYVKNFDLIRMPRLDVLLQQGQAEVVNREGLRLFSLREAPWRDLTFDVAVTSLRPFRVRNNVLTAALRPDLRLRGKGELPHLIGNVYVDSASISLPSTTLEFEQGLIQFLDTNPFVPQLGLAAQTRMLGYDINVSVSGNYVEPRIAISSVPPLPQDDLVMLVTTGRPPEEGFNERNRQKAITGVVVFLGKDLLGKIFGSESTETEQSVWEKFEVTTGQDVTRTGQETIEASFLMARDAISRDNAIYIVAERDAYGDYNGGVRLVFRLW